MIIDGKTVSELILGEIKSNLKGRPILTVVQVGQDPASTTYIRTKRKACERVGIESRLLSLPEEIGPETLLFEIEKLNRGDTHGILLQLPLPAHLDPHLMLEAIAPNKDVDGFHPINMGRLMKGLDCFIPCTPLGIQTVLQRSNIAVEGKRVVIVGRSQIVGMPLSTLLMQKQRGCNATVTVAHSCTPNLEEVTQEADILVAAIGRPNFIQPNMVKEGAVVIDVGINRVDKKLVGDVDFEKVKPKCSAITPVPGGVGPMTVAMLLKNTVKACENL
ncbi:MAG: Bifunctional protein FolD protein [Chlamydiales bacterium]|nr:Bifunctional protein FolD protein [Chlamydiales bacterium]MCH9636092.1 Bifunctional protein FolD protein [Chlamydiales bacterium]MCH9703151.1 bifunctional 5,10-methylenetetrahydrofolate dehydrogenase/5,10-methenyltetrahydrofolate cyclohydrolase [Chlamydiota bacterium]